MGALNAAAAGHSFDILGFGAVAVDDLLYVKDYPAADTKMQVLRHERHCGGLTATALVAAARLGAHCAYAGVLGTDELSEFAVQCMNSEHINTSHLIRRTEARPVQSTIIVDETRLTRNIFYNLNGAMGADALLPDANVIRAAKVIYIDHIGMEGMLRAAKIAHEADIPLVADLEGDDSPLFAELFSIIDHLILSKEFADKITNEHDPSIAARKLWNEHRDTVIVTCGVEGCWVLNAVDQAPVHYPAFKVEAVDTTGCGDVFHGAYAAALVKGLGIHERVRFASAAAAIKAQSHGGQAGIPDLDAVELFLQQNN